MLETIGVAPALSVVLFALICARILLPGLSFGQNGGGESEQKKGGWGRSQWGIFQTTGSREVQADCAQVSASAAGVMAVMADGIGKENTGQLSAQIAVDTVLDRFEPYHVLNNPEYFFRTSFGEAHLRVQRTIGNRRGGTCLAAVFVRDGRLHYALAGDIRIALLRGRELIPISEGQTMDVLAVKAYEVGSLSRREAIWSMEEKRTWNYLGMDGFREIETPPCPVRLKPGDCIFMATKGIWQELSWAELEDVLLEEISIQEKADRIGARAEHGPGWEKENGSVLLLEAEESDETDKF